MAIKWRTAKVDHGERRSNRRVQEVGVRSCRSCRSSGAPHGERVKMRVFDGLVAFVPEGQADRSQARSAWDNATPKSRPVGYGVIRAAVRADSMIGVTKFQIRRLKPFTLSVRVAGPDQTVPYGTALWRDAFPGTSCLATIRLSLRDKIRSTDRR